MATDTSNPASPVTVPPGKQYTFLNSGNGFAANVTVGSIAIADAPDYPEGQLFQFQVLER